MERAISARVAAVRTDMDLHWLGHLASFEQRMERIATVGAGLCVALGLLVLLGWTWDVALLKRAHPDFESMKANAALAFILAGLALLASTISSSTRNAGVGLGLMLVALAVATLLEDLWATDFGIDEFLVPDPEGATGEGAPGRMSPGTAVCFLLSGLAIVGLRFITGVAVAQILAITSFSIALVGFTGYLFGAKSLYDIGPSSSMALHTSVGLLLLNAAIIVARPGYGFAKPVTRMPTPAAVLFRRLLPFSLVIPLTLGAILLSAQYYAGINAMFAMAVASAATAMLLVGLIGWTFQSVGEKDMQFREAKSYFETMLRSIGDAVLVTDTGGRVRFMNPVAEALTGWSFTAAYGNPLDRIFVIIDETTRKPANNPFAEALARAAVIGVANHNILVDRGGKEHAIDDSVAPIVDSSGATRGLIFVFREVTQRRQEELLVKESESRFRSLAHSLPLPLWVHDAEGRQDFVNHTFCEFFGVNEADMRGGHWKMLIHPEDSSYVDTFMECVRERKDFNASARARTGSGEWRLIESIGRPRLAENGEFMGYLGVSFDITDRRRSEDANRFLADIAVPLNSLEDYKATLQAVARRTVPDLADWCAIELADRDGQLIRIASSHATFEQADPPDHTRTGTSPTPDSILAEIILTGQARYINNLTDQHLHLLANNESQLNTLRKLNPTAFLGSPIALPGRSFGVMALFNLESERKFSDKDLALAERATERIALALENTRLYETIREADERKDVFLSMLAHELRNPLGALGNGIEVLRRKNGDEENRLLFDLLDRQKRQLTRLLDDLLDVSRISQGKVVLKKSRTALQPILTSAIANAQHRLDDKGHSLTTEFPPVDLLLHADPARIEQIVTNLLVNAAKYTPEGGKIKLSARGDGKWLVLTVEDNGIGISADELAKVFDLFRQIHPGHASTSSGLGLGLTLVQELTELHGGNVSAHSDGDGLGSTFTVRLAIVTGAAEGVTDPADAALDAGAGQAATNTTLDILLVDDNVDSVMALKTLLELQGHRIRTAFTGKAAIAAVAESAPNLVLLDLGLPDISGLEVAQQLRQQPGGEGIYLLALTGYGQPRDRARSREAGFDQHMVKPLDIDALQQTIARLAGASID